jgi:CheY-like chemotaxis protein
MQKPFHILIADDDPDDQLIIKEALSVISSTLDCASVYNGVQLLNYLNKKDEFVSVAAPDLILLDINMPLLDGLQALENVKRNEQSKNIPVYMLSTLRTIERVERSLALGALNIYSKPNSISGYYPIFKEILDTTAFAQLKHSSR